jgi:CRP-like cAMP-binding protein
MLVQASAPDIIKIKKGAWRSVDAGSIISNPLIAKLANVIELSPEDRATLNHLCGTIRHVTDNRDIIREGDRPNHVHLVLKGWAARYKVLPDGRRQITAFLVPGDFCDMHITILQEMDHSISALTPVTVADVPHDAIEELARSRPDLTKALWWTTLVDEAVLRSWIVNLGRRNAFERIAHLICEMHLRLTHVGLVKDDRFGLPLTQEELGDATGLTPVHINRVLGRLRAENLFEWQRGTITILDMEGLRRVAGFDPNYLHSKPLAASPRPMPPRSAYPGARSDSGAIQ